jgi:hypothetical protein
MRIVLLALCALVALPIHAADCYVGVAGGRSSVNYAGIDKLEERLFASEYATGEYREEKSSATSELQFGCVLSRRYGLKVELGVLEGFRHLVHTNGTLTFQGFEEDFTVDRVVRARGYMVSGLWEKQLSQKTYLFGRFGALRAVAMADIYPMGEPYSVHAEKSAWLPVVGIGMRAAFDDRWSLAAEYRAIGIPWERDRQVNQLLIGGQYSLR